MSANRYGAATAAEKSTFTKLAALLVSFLAIASVKITHRELREEKNPKYIFALSKNNALVYTLEFRLKKGIIQSLSMVVSRVTLKSDFGKALGKTFKEAKIIYGGVVVRIPIEDPDNLPEILDNLAKLIAASDELELDPKRTYYDPPQGWVDGVENPPVKKAEKKEEAEEVEAPEAEEAQAPMTAEEAALADMAAA